MTTRTPKLVHVSDWQHTASTLALCIVAFAHSYLLISVFPYSGFMAIELIPSLDEENAGFYAGFIAASFMTGRSVSAYGWGKLADRYGRVAVLQASLALSCLFSLLFGMSTNYCVALIWRFMLGLSNGLISTAKTSVSELANGDKTLEAHSMSKILSMWGGAFLIAPAISGAIVEPIQQYPNINWIRNGVLSGFFRTFPFALPNIVGSLFCLVGMVLVRLFITETLPARKCRPTKHIPHDVLTSVRNVYRRALPAVPETMTEESIPIMSNQFKPVSYNSSKNIDTSSTSEEEEDDDDDYDDQDIPKEIVMTYLEQDADDAVHEAQLCSDEVATSAINTDAARESLIRCSIASQQQQQDTMRRRMSDASAMSLPPATISSLWNQKNVRLHLSINWLASFIMVEIDEAFPLYCMSVASGLGIRENSIGQILSISGLIYFVIQLSLYAPLLKRLGLYGSIRLGAALMAPLAALIPFSAVLNRGTGGDISTTAFVFLSLILALSRVFALTLFSGISVATNRLVPASHRATLNGLNTLGGSVAKAMGPAFAGFLVSFFFSSGIFNPHLAAFLLYGSVGILSGLTAVACYLFLHDPDDDDAQKVMRLPT